MCPMAHTCITYLLPIAPTRGGTLGKIDLPALKNYKFSKFIGYIRVHYWCYIFYVLGKCIKTCVYHYSIIHNIFTTLKFFHVLPIHSCPQPLATTNLFHDLHRFVFSRMTFSFKSYAMQPFHIAFFYLVISI